MQLNPVAGFHAVSRAFVSPSRKREHLFAFALDASGQHDGSPWRASDAGSRPAAISDTLYFKSSVAADDKRFYVNMHEVGEHGCRGIEILRSHKCKIDGLWEDQLVHDNRVVIGTRANMSGLIGSTARLFANDGPAEGKHSPKGLPEGKSFLAVNDDDGLVREAAFALLTLVAESCLPQHRGAFVREARASYEAFFPIAGNGIVGSDKNHRTLL